MKKNLLWVVAGALYLAFATYAVVAETGPMGWLNAVQQSVFGSYSRKVSFMVLLFGGIALGLGLLWIWASLDELAHKGSPSAPRANAASLFPAEPAAAPRTMSWALGSTLGFLVAMALVWGAAWVYGWWDLRQRTADSVAAYEPLELTAAMQSPGKGRQHLALRGRVLGDHVVSQTSKGSAETPGLTLVPLVERGWREGDPVHFVLRLDRQGPSALRQALRDSPALFVRADGGVPTPALQVFEQMKSPIAADAIAVRLVATQDGRPTPVPQEIDWSDAIVWAVVGSFAVALGYLMILIMPWAQRRQARKALRQQERRAAQAAR